MPHGTTHKLADLPHRAQADICTISRLSLLVSRIRLVAGRRQGNGGHAPALQLAAICSQCEHSTANPLIASPLLSCCTGSNRITSAVRTVTAKTCSGITPYPRRTCPAPSAQGCLGRCPPGPGMVFDLCHAATAVPCITTEVCEARRPTAAAMSTLLQPVCCDCKCKCK